MKFALCVILGVGLWAGAPVRAEDPFNAREGGRVLQFLIDPANRERAWMLTETLLQFNADLKSEEGWKVVFDESVFRKVTGVAPGSNYRHKRIQLTKRQGQLYLLVEPDVGRGANFLLRTNDYGENWEYSRMGKGGGGFSRTPPKAAPKPEPRTARRRTTEKAVDLRELAEDSPTERKGGPPSVSAPAGQPLFRVLFDLLLQIRPGANPLTFDNYHTLLLVELFPRPEIQFSFEVSPSPRYYELKYKISDRLAIRGGRIWIPFDRMSPHNYFGGFVNTSLLRQPGSAAFLPDLWTDLGLGLDYQLVDASDLDMLLQLYVVNGFRDGAADPMGEVGTRYPDFENAPILDNNGDKALGARLSARFENTVGLGLSAYSGRYTANGDSASRINMLGADLQLTPFPGTVFTAGYLYMKIGLPAGAAQRDFLRGGFYAELSQKVADRWRVVIRGGASQNDSRVQDVTDQQIVGGSIIYDPGLFKFSFQYFRDLLDVPGKVVREYTALRAVALF